MDLTTLYQVCAWLSTALFVVCFMPQVYTTLKHKNVEGQNPWTWLSLVGAYSFGLVFSLGTWQPPLILNFGVGDILSLTMLVCYFKYRK